MTTAKSLNVNGKKTENDNEVDSPFKDYVFLLLPMIIIPILITYVMRVEHDEHNSALHPRLRRYYGQLPFKYIEEFHNISCSNSYDDSRKLNSKFEPTYCGRIISDFIANANDVSALSNVVRNIFKDSELPLNGVSLLDINNEILFKNSEFLMLFSTIQNQIMHKIKESFNVDQLYPTSPSFISRISEKPVAELKDEYWHNDYDRKLYKSVVFTSVVFLSSYNVDCIGGNLVFNDSNSLTAIEPKLGRILIYTSGSENQHYTTKVTNGYRYSLKLGFTYDKNLE